jgi:hypothetical protein
MNINTPKTKRTLGTTDGAATSVFSGPGHLLRAVCSVGATARWFKFYDKGADTAPTIADTPVLNVWVPVGGTVTLDFGSIGFPLTNGFGHRCSVVGTDVDATYTSFAAGDSAVTLLYQTGV